MPEPELPPTSPEFVALRIFAAAHLRTLKPKDQMRFSTELVKVMAEMEEAPIEMRPPEQHAAVQTARVRAIAWVRRAMTDVMRRL